MCESLKLKLQNPSVWLDILFESVKCSSLDTGHLLSKVSKI